MSSTDLLLTFNTGSSTVKIGIFAIDGAEARRIGKGVIDFRAEPLSLRLTKGLQTFEMPLKAEVTEDLHGVIDETFALLADHFDMTAARAAGHRVVHGGDRFIRAIALDAAAIDAVDALTPLAPLHQPQALRFIRALKHLKPHLAQTASFDTAFHATQDDLVRRFAIPRTLHDEGIKRYGFHGLSYKFIAGELRRKAPRAAKVVVAHLGSGASLCALDDGVSRDCSMGFSTLDGIPMATRPGWLDPGVILHLAGQRKQSFKEIEDLLYHRSGLLGVSGISADTRELLKDGRPQSRQAIDLFTLRIAGEIGRMAATLNGLDAIVFTAGIGEHQPEIRAGVAKRLSWLGLAIDEKANAANDFTISTRESRIATHVIATDEEQVIAEEALSLLHGG
ncbi:acetate/propionate family kinase [Rhizobium beringeri]|uniref:acetate/propionate family kinase n=1 Tax=Rhizobium TaxID=379 RepID=UPI000FEC7BF3|nr:MULTISPECIES: acetate/propionate family kinase [Rhizobium]MBY5460405.1 acetate/propionate family kinase [Rhizobium leguminosarum]NKL66242.1 acetate/propionate family kinase [Rhizobium leguminosarum bv. viciae]RWX10923.1 acetate/propionate family kinase [Rhizobium leguminosarum]WSH50340.1 acetate/propionate family kinase [Rhizobium beringeri]WSH79464.1 acetate/propionate family kinase [Rhizobium beringeri]